MDKKGYETVLFEVLEQYGLTLCAANPEELFFVEQVAKRMISRNESMETASRAVFDAMHRSNETAYLL